MSASRLKKGNTDFAVAVQSSVDPLSIYTVNVCKCVYFAFTCSFDTIVCHLSTIIN